jgi:hypothetical protein
MWSLSGDGRSADIAFLYQMTPLRNCPLDAMNMSTLGRTF